MAKIITVASQKGGVGKTTTALNLGYSLSRLGGPVLLIDGDPQGGLGAASNLKKKTSHGLVDLLDGTQSADEVITKTRDGRMAVLGVGAKTLDDVAKLELASNAQALRDTIRSVSRGFDYTLIDAPAGLGSIVSTLFSASDSVLATINCRPLAMRGLPLMLRLIKDIGAQTSRLRLEGVLITMMNSKNDLDKNLRAQLAKRVPEEAFFHTEIPFDDQFEMASLRSIPVALLPDAPEVARRYMDLALELKAKELLTQPGDADERTVGLF